MKFLLIGFFVCISFGFFSQEKPAYLIYDIDGKQVNYSQVLKSCSNADIVFFGELHNNPIAHWLEYELLKDLINLKEKRIVVGAEMFEADNQLVIDELMNKLIPMSKWEENVRLWNNYNTDYKPIVDLCYKNGLRLVATNIPRRYAAKVARYGFESLDSLSDEAKKYIAPLPIAYDENLSCYKNMLNMSAMSKTHTTNNLPKAQAIKDATMAHFILKNLPQNGIFFHINGSYHSDYFEGIVWYIKKAINNSKIVTISTIESYDISQPELKEIKGKANFVIIIPESMTKTY